MQGLPQSQGAISTDLPFLLQKKEGTCFDRSGELWIEGLKNVPGEQPLLGSSASPIHFSEACLGEVPSGSFSPLNQKVYIDWLQAISKNAFPRRKSPIKNNPFIRMNSLQPYCKTATSQWL